MRLEGDRLGGQRQAGDAGHRADDGGRDENDEMADHGIHRWRSLSGRAGARLPGRSREAGRRFIAGCDNRAPFALNLSDTACD
ncbi:hypothetical protein STAQ_33840 [Allostella sp. ATCC 35155]|nr:hypothetical protein STAQ_33840 [Stella sp. ATCC 35155]